MRRTMLVLAAGLISALFPLQAVHADPLYCVVVHDRQGNPVDTVCAPWPGN